MEKKQEIKELIAGACFGAYIALLFLLALFDQKILIAIFTLVPTFIIFFPSFIELIRLNQKKIIKKRSKKVK